MATFPNNDPGIQSVGELLQEPSPFWGKEGGFVDDALARLGLERRVTVALPHAMVAPHVIASSDLLLTMPERVARVLAPPLDLVVLEPPQELPLTGFTISMLWHDRTHSDPARRWLRDVIVSEATERSRKPTSVATRPRARAGFEHAVRARSSATLVRRPTSGSTSESGWFSASGGAML